jgi:hypothetical protein
VNTERRRSKATRRPSGEKTGELSVLAEVRSRIGVAVVVSNSAMEPGR